MVDAVYRIRSGGGSATAFCIHPSGWFLTCAHSVLGVPTIGLIRYDRALEYLPAELVDANEGEDVALLRATSDRAFSSLKLAHLAANPGADLWVIGHVPWDVADDFWINYKDGKAHLDLDRAIQIPATLTVDFPETEDSPHTVAYATHRPVGTGWSGGPVVKRSTGEVVAMHSGGLHDGLMRGSNLVALQKMLSKHRIRSKQCSSGRLRANDPEREQRGWRAAAERYCERFVVTSDPEDFADGAGVKDAMAFISAYREQLTDVPLLDLCEATVLAGRKQLSEARALALRALEMGEIGHASNFLAKVVDVDSHREVLQILLEKRKSFDGLSSYLGERVSDDLNRAITTILWNAKAYVQLAEHLDEVMAKLPARLDDLYRRLWHARALAKAERYEEAVSMYEAQVTDHGPDINPNDLALLILALRHSGGEDEKRRAVVLAMSLMPDLYAPKDGFVDAAWCAQEIGKPALAALLLERSEIARNSISGNGTPDG